MQKDYKKGTLYRINQYVFVLGICLLPTFCTVQAQQGYNTQSRISENGAEVIVDGSTHGTGAIRSDKFFELVGQSTPTTPATGHAKIFLSSATRNMGVEFDNGTVVYLSTGSPGSITAVVAGLGLFGGASSGSATLNLTSPIASSFLSGTYTITVSTAQALSFLVSLSTAVTGTLPIANGGTNSSTALNNNLGIISSGGKLVEDSHIVVASNNHIGIFRLPAVQNPAEYLAVLDTTTPQGLGGSGSVDVTVNNAGTSSSRFITQSNYCINAVCNPDQIDTYMASAGSADPGNWWSNGPLIAKSNYMQFQNGVQTMFEVFGDTTNTNTDLYFWENNSTSTIHFNHGSSGTEDFNINSSSVNVNQNLVVSSGVYSKGSFGTSGQALESNGSNTAPSWVTLFKPHVVISSTTGNGSTTSSTYQAMNPSLSITPQSTSNMIQVCLTTHVGNHNGNSTNCYTTIERNSTDISTSGKGFSANSQISNSAWWFPTGFCVIDSPNSTSAVTYQGYLKSSDNTTSCSWNELGQTVELTAVEIPQ